MSGKRYTQEFKAEAVKQVLERGHSTASVATRLGVNKHSLYEWLARANKLGTAAVTTSEKPSGSSLSKSH
jgi:transposase